jgi:hypothetical protein
MVDWRGSSLQIVITLIGSGLILTALTSLTSYFIKPSLDIYITVQIPPTNEPQIVSLGANRTMTFPADNSTTYRIYLVNNGYSTANDVRLTMTYPGAAINDTRKVYENENITITNTRTDNITGQSVVTLTRLNPGVMVAVENTITGYGIRNLESDPLIDFQGSFLYIPQESVYWHVDPFSAAVTYDQGGKTYAPSATSRLYSNGYEVIDPDAISFIIPIVTIVIGILLFGIAFRHKSKGVSKFASNILKDIEATIRRLRTVIDSRAVLPFKNYDLYVDNLDRVFDNYKDYKLIEDFYTGLKERASKITIMMKDGHLESNELSYLKDLNALYLHRAMLALNEIDWKKFYKFDLILLLPAIILASTFISMICDLGTAFLLGSKVEEMGFSFTYYYMIISFLVRSLATYYITKLILYRVQGFSITTRVLPVISQPKKFFMYCAAIMGFSSGIVVVLLMYALGGGEYTSDPGFPLIIIGFDIARMFLLLWLVSRSLRTNKKEENILVKGNQ